jgi:hypothetical protein
VLVCGGSVFKSIKKRTRFLPELHGIVDGKIGEEFK